MKIKHFTFYFLILLALNIFGKSETNEQRISLAEAVKKAIKTHPSIKSSTLEIEKTKLLVKEVKQSRLIPVLKLSGKTGVVPEARGDIFSSEDDQTDLDGLGLFYKLDLKIVQPIFTFGRGKSALTAANSGVELSITKKRGVTEKVSFDVIKSYWALAGAKRAVKVASKLKKDFAKLQKEVEKLLEDEDSEVDDSQLLEVKANKFAIEEQFIKSKNSVLKAEEILKTLTGTETSSQLVPVNHKIPRFLIKKGDIEKLSQKVLISHFSLKGIESAERALSYKKKFLKSDMKPIIYLGGGFSWAHAPHRTDQKNPFVSDSFNYTNIGAFIGAEWDLNPYKKRSAWKKVEKEEGVLKNDSRIFKEKLRLDTRNSLLKTSEKFDSLKALKKSLKAAKSWLTLSLDNWESGLGEVAPLIKAYKTYYQLKGLEIKRETELSISIAELAYKIGDIKKYLKWVKNEQIQIN